MLAFATFTSKTGKRVPILAVTKPIIFLKLTPMGASPAPTFHKAAQVTCRGRACPCPAPDATPGQSHQICGTGSTSVVITSQLSKLCFINARYKAIENLDAIAPDATQILLTKSQTAGILISIKKVKGKERDKYLLLNNREPWVGATRQQAEAKSTREPARQASTVAPVNRQH